MSNESTNRYPPSVDKLLTYGDARNFRQWPDYLQLGLGAEHVPDLIRMATDDDLLWADSDSLEVWAPIHGWRALGQLRAEAAIEPLLTLLHRIDDNDDDWVGEELPRVYGMIGPAAIPALAAYLADSAHDLFARIAAAHSLEQVSRLHSNARDECVSVLTRQLERFAENDPTINGFLISYLLDLNAVEAAPMTLPLAESVVEEATLNWFDALGYTILHGPDLAPGESNAERTSYSDLALPNHSHSALT